MINKSTRKKQVLNYAIDTGKFWARVDRSGDCWVWQKGRNSGGYGVFSVRNTPEQYELTGRSFTQLVAHRVAVALSRPLMAGDYVMHTCDNPPCCNPEHLRIGTASDNMRDAVAKGRHKGPLRLHQYNK